MEFKEYPKFMKMNFWKTNFGKRTLLKKQPLLTDEKVTLCKNMSFCQIK